VLDPGPRSQDPSGWYDVQSWREHFLISCGIVDDLPGCSKVEYMILFVIGHV